MQLEMFEELPESKIKLEDLFQAYFDCRVHKRNTGSALKFEADYESQLVRLWEEINDGTYKIGQSVCLIVPQARSARDFAVIFATVLFHIWRLIKLTTLSSSVLLTTLTAAGKGRALYTGFIKSGTIFASVPRITQRTATF